jgi:pyruvate/2-oxoglutarate dehydrogenase complex dihydrolipoamide acyltransferase (E2) component
MWPSDRVLVVFTILVGSTLTASGFLSPQALSPASKSIKRSMLLRYQGSRSTWSLSAAKGFGNTPPPPPPPKKSKKSSSASPSSAAATTTTTTTTTPPKAPPSSGSKSEDRMLLENGYNPFLDEQERQPELSQGKAALAKLRRQEAEKRNEELRKIKEVQQVDEMLRESPDAAAIPEKVAQRMGARMLPFVGIPLFGAMGSFVGFWYMATYRDMEFQPALVATVSLVLLAVGLVVSTLPLQGISKGGDISL